VVAGLKHRARNRESGTVTSVYDAEVQGMDPESGKYAVVCEDHSTCVNVDTLRLAVEVARYPAANFCEVCSGEVEAR
jgi:hypothetical protein